MTLLAQGPLYLRSAPTERLTSVDGTYQYLYPLCERYKRSEVWAQTNWLGIWAGPAATDFYRAHAADLKAGAAINVNIERIRIHSDGAGRELQCLIQSARMLPPRWPAGAPAEGTTSGTASVLANTARPSLPAQSVSCSADAR